MKVITIPASRGNVLMLFVLVQFASNRPSSYTLTVNYYCTMFDVNAEVTAWCAIFTAENHLPSSKIPLIVSAFALMISITMSDWILCAKTALSVASAL